MVLGQAYWKYSTELPGNCTTLAARSSRKLYSDYPAVARARERQCARMQTRTRSYERIAKEAAWGNDREYRLIQITI